MSGRLGMRKAYVSEPLSKRGPEGQHQIVRFHAHSESPTAEMHGVRGLCFTSQYHFVAELPKPRRSEKVMPARCANEELA